MQQNLVRGEDHRDDRTKAMGSSSGAPGPINTCSEIVSIDRLLAQDYSGITGCMAHLDEQISAFANNLTQLNEHAPSHAGLSVLWEEQATSICSDTPIKTDGASMCERAIKPAPATSSP